MANVSFLSGGDVALLLTVVLTGVWSIATRRRLLLDLPPGPAADPYTQHLALVQEKIGALPLDEAQQRGNAALENQERWRCVKAKPDDAIRLSGFAPGLADLMARFESVEAVSSEARVARRDVDRFAPHPAFLTIGKFANGRGFLVVQPGEETVYEVSGKETTDDEWLAAASPSIYHWLLVENATFGGGDEEDEAKSAARAELDGKEAGDDEPRAS